MKTVWPMHDEHARILSFANAVLSKLKRLGKRGYALREPTPGYSVVVEAERGRPSLLIKAHRTDARMVQITYRDCPNVAPRDAGSPVMADTAERVAEIVAGDKGGPDAFAISADSGRLEARNMRPY